MVLYEWLFFPLVLFSCSRIFYESLNNLDRYAFLHIVDKNRLMTHFKEHVTDFVKLFTHHERPFQKTRKEKIKDLKQLTPGDHISFYKTDFYYGHHGIVFEIGSNYLRMIHYFNTLEHARRALLKGSIYIASIIVSDWKVNVKSTFEEVYLHHYDNIPCFSNEDTLTRARLQIGQRGYSLLENNCEHWSRWCRTGEHYSEQIYNFHRLVKQKSATLLIIDPTALLVKDVAVVGMRTFSQFLSAAGSGVILTVIESISATIDIRNKKHLRDRGSLSNVALKKYIVRRITSASMTVAGGTAGTIAGSILIPVPILGPTIGGTVGGLAGKLTGGVTGIALSKIIEIYDKVQTSKIKKMSVVPQLMAQIAPSSDIVHGLTTLTFHNHEERIAEAVQEAISPKPLQNLLYPSLDEFMSDDPVTQNMFYKSKDLAAGLFSDDNSTEYFVLTPIPDENAHEQFASSNDVLMLRWPIGVTKPWECREETVLDIDEFISRKE